MTQINQNANHETIYEPETHMVKKSIIFFFKRLIAFEQNKYVTLNCLKN